MENPGVKTLYEFLKIIKEKQPTTFSELAAIKNDGFGIVSRYLKFCLKHDLIEIVETRKTRGRFLSKLYALTVNGHSFLRVFRGFDDGL